jgi:metal-sulfur cluster biosynthetic enzyme
VTSTTVAQLSDKRRISKRVILQILHEVNDPGVPMTLEEMGIINMDWIHVDDGNIQVDYRPTSNLCPVGMALGVVIKYVLEENLDKDVEVRMLRGSHFQVDLVNDLLGDRGRYEKALERLTSSGFVNRCRR